MFPKAPETVNLQSTTESTIDLGALASQRHWLIDQGRRLPWLTRWAFRCLPARCYFCGRASELHQLDLCGECLEGLPWASPERVPRRLGSGAPAFAAFDYRAPVAEALKALKFTGDRRAARLLGAVLAMRLATQVATGAGALPDVLLPVPLHHARHVERGFNQLLLLARHAGYWLRRPVHCGAVLRIKATRPQTSLHAIERQQNLAGAFFVSPQLRRELRRRKLRRVTIIDDVLTTGATLDALATALQEAGIRELQCWSVARAMPTNIARPT